MTAPTHDELAGELQDAAPPHHIIQTSIHTLPQRCKEIYERSYDVDRSMFLNVFREVKRKPTFTSQKWWWVEHIASSSLILAYALHHVTESS